MSQPAAEQFDRVAAAYVTSQVHARGADLAWLVEALAPRPHWHVLDLGTGAGHAALAVAPAVSRVTAVDLSARMLATAARLAAERGVTNIEFLSADVASLPLPDRALDAAFSRYSAHHWPDPARALHEVARVLAPGAPLALIDTVSPEHPALDTFVNALELLRDPSHVRDARLGEWRHWLEDAGFTLRSVREWPVVLETEDWLARSATEQWRADACRRLLDTAPDAARRTFAIDNHGATFSLLGALLVASRR